MCEVILCEDTPIFWTVVCDTIKKKTFGMDFFEKSLLCSEKKLFIS